MALNNFLEKLNISYGRKFEAIERNYAVYLQDVKPQIFGGITFGIDEDSVRIRPKDQKLSWQKIVVTRILSDGFQHNSSSSISIPPTVFNNLRLGSEKQRIIFVAYKSTKFLSFIKDFLEQATGPVLVVFSTLLDFNGLNTV